MPGFVSAFVRIVVALVAIGTAGGIAHAAYVGDMTVVLVQSASPGCTTICPQWIAADGKITPATPALFAKIFKAIGKTPLPVIVNSQGGDVDAAMAIGRMIRARHLDVAIGRTYYGGCGPADSACKLGKGEVARGDAISSWGICASACPLILAGGVHRYANGAGLVGVHQVIEFRHMERVNYRIFYRIKNGRKIIIRREVVGRKRLPDRTITGGDAQYRASLAAYLKEMGISELLLKLADSAPPSQIRRLTWQELNDTGLVTEVARTESLTRSDLCQEAALPPHCLPVAAKPAPK